MCETLQADVALAADALPDRGDTEGWRKRFGKSWEFSAGKRLRLYRPRGGHTRALCSQCKLEGTAEQVWNVHSPHVCREAQKNPPPDEHCSYPMPWATKLAERVNQTPAVWRTATVSHKVLGPGRSLHPLHLIAWCQTRSPPIPSTLGYDPARPTLFAPQNSRAARLLSCC